MPKLIRALRTLGICLGLFLATYGSTFTVVHLLKRPLETTVPLIIGISFLVCLLLMLSLCVFAHFRWFEFGFRLPSPMLVAWTLGAGIPLATGLTWLDHRFGGAGPLAGLSLPLWISLLYFGVWAPLQEETIFRGLIQGAVGRSSPGGVSIAGTRISIATLIVAVLFALIHLEVAVFTAFVAFVLGVFAGELRERSGSLVPGIIVHSLFNLGGFLWTLAS
jgi:membrane protease YdiL (CAAX protease family)